MRSYFLTPQGSYYEGDRAHQLDVEVPQRPSADHYWQAGAWQIDPPSVLQDRRAEAFTDAMDKVVLRMLFQMHNRMLTLELKPTIGPAAFRQVVVDLYKQVNP